VLSIFRCPRSNWQVLDRISLVADGYGESALGFARFA
jgi:hypothetical protein